MRVKYLKFILLLPSLSFVQAQQIELNGQVSIHNSKYETGTIQYVNNAYITAPFTKAVSSDSEGRFTLEFVEIPPGTSITLKAEKSGFEVVNNYDLQDVVIGRSSPIRIYLTTTGKLADAQTKLYNISREALFRKHNSIISRLKKDKQEQLKALKELESYFNVQIEDHYHAIQLVKDRMSEVEKQLPQFAQELASTNLDFASDLYIRAFQKVQLGEIEEALSLLDSVALEDSYESALETLEKGKKMEDHARDLQIKGQLQLEQIFHSLELKANAQYLLFQYAASGQTFEKLAKLYETHAVDPLKKAKNYDELGTLFYLNGEFTKAEYYQEKALKIKDSLLPDSHPELAISMNMMAQIKARQGLLDQSIPLQRKVIAIKESQLEKNDVELAIVYGNLSLMLMESDKYEEAYELQIKSLDINLENFGENSLEVAKNYATLGRIFGDVSQTSEALKYELKGLEIRRSLLDPDNPLLGTSLNGVGQLYRQMGDYQKALQFMQEGLDLAMRIYHPKHYIIAGHLSGLSEVYHQMNELESAIDYQKRALEIRKAALGENHRTTANSYNLLSRFYNDAGDFQKAMENQLRAIEIKEQVLPKNDSRLASSYYTMGIIQQSLKDYGKALEFHKKALDMRVATFGEEHQMVANSLYRMAQVYLEQKDYRSALENMIRVTAFDEKANGFPHQYVAEDYMALSKIYIQLKELENVRKYRIKANEVIEALDENNRGTLQTQLKELDEAIKKMQE